MRDALPYHPTTGIQALFVLDCGRAVYPIKGGSDDHEETNDDQDDVEETGGDDAEGEDGDESDEDSKPLGPKGEQALARIKAKERASREDLRKANAEIARLKAKGDDTDGEQSPAELAAQSRAAKADEKIKRAAVKTAAAGKMVDPSDAHLYLSLADIDVDEDGDVDEDELADLIDEILEKKPHLKAAQGGNRFQGSADGGVRKGSKPNLDQQIADATKAGNHKLAIQLKRQQAYTPEKRRKA